MKPGGTSVRAASAMIRGGAMVAIRYRPLPRSGTHTSIPSSSPSVMCMNRSRYPCGIAQSTSKSASMNSCGNRPAPALKDRSSSLRTTLCAPSQPTMYLARTVSCVPSAPDSAALTPEASWVRPCSATPRSIDPPSVRRRSVRIRSVSYWGSPRWAYGSSGRFHSTRCV